MSTFDRSYHVWDCNALLRIVCPRNWEELDPSPNDGVRHCRACKRDVHLCLTPADFVSHGEQGHCVAIPDSLSYDPNHRLLGEPRHEEVLELDRAVAWWEDVLLREPALDADRIEAIRATRGRLAESASIYSKEYIALLKKAAQTGGVICPRCGEDIVQDHLGAIISLAIGGCCACGQPMEFELPLA
jgi:hypothetical protein